MKLGRIQRIALFVGIAFVGSWSLAATFWLLDGRWGSPAGRALGVLYMVPPAFAALVVQGAVTKEPIIEPFAIRFPRNRWFFIAWLAPVAMLGIALAVGAWLGLDVVTRPEQLPARGDGDDAGLPVHPGILVLYGLLAGLTIDMVLGFAEELGWRGFLLRWIPGGFWPRALVGGVLWGLWNVPLVLQGHLYPEHPRIGAVLIVGWTTLVSPILCYLRLRAGTLFAAAAFRGTLMALWPVARDVTLGGTDVIEPFYGVTGFVAGAVVLGSLWVHDATSEQPLMRRPAARNANG